MVAGGHPSPAGRNLGLAFLLANRFRLVSVRLLSLANPCNDHPQCPRPCTDFLANIALSPYQFRRDLLDYLLNQGPDLLADTAVSADQFGRDLLDHRLNQGTGLLAYTCCYQLGCALLYLRPNQCTYFLTPTCASAYQIGRSVLAYRPNQITDIFADSSAYRLGCSLLNYHLNQITGVHADTILSAYQLGCFLVTCQATWLARGGPVGAGRVRGGRRCDQGHAHSRRNE